MAEAIVLMGYENYKTHYNSDITLEEYIKLPEHPYKVMLPIYYVKPPVGEGVNTLPDDWDLQEGKLEDGVDIFLRDTIYGKTNLNASPVSHNLGFIYGVHPEKGDDGRLKIYEIPFFATDIENRQTMDKYLNLTPEDSADKAFLGQTLFPLFSVLVATRPEDINTNYDFSNTIRRTMFENKNDSKTKYHLQVIEVQKTLAKIGVTWYDTSPMPQLNPGTYDESKVEWPFSVNH